MQMSSGDLKETKKQLKTAQNNALLAEAEEKRDRKLADERAELRERSDNQKEEKDTHFEMAEYEDMEVQPVSLTVEEGFILDINPF